MLLCLVLQGQKVNLSVASSGDVIAAPAGPADITAAATATAAATSTTLDRSEPPSPPAEPCQLPGASWRSLARAQGSAFIRVLQESEFQPDVVGAKACNLAKLRSKLPEWILVPRSVALPFGTFEAVLADSANAEVAAELSLIEQQLEVAARAVSSSNGNGRHSSNGNGKSSSNGDAASAMALLTRARELVTCELKPPAGMQQVRMYLAWLLCAVPMYLFNLSAFASTQGSLLHAASLLKSMTHGGVQLP